MSSFNWVFTCFDVDAITELPEGIRYIYFGREICPDTQRPHLQGFLNTIKKRRLNGVQSLLPAHCHLERMRGSLEQNITYCGKDGQVTEFGDKPLSRKEVGEKNSAASKEVISFAELGDHERIKEKHPGLYLRYFSTLKKIEADYLTSLPKKKLEHTDNFWIWGEAGSGKSLLAEELCGTTDEEVHDHLNSKWWNGYHGQPNVIFEDLHYTMPFINTYLKIWADRKPFNAQIKGTSFKIRPKRLVVTSNHSIERCITDPDDLKAFQRRFTEFHVPEFDPYHYQELMEKHEARLASDAAKYAKIKEAIAHARANPRPKKTAFDKLMESKPPAKKRRYDLDKAAGPHSPVKSDNELDL